MVEGMLDHTLLSNPCLPATELSQHDTSSNARLLAAVPARWPEVAGTLTSPSVSRPTLTRKCLLLQRSRSALNRICFGGTALAPGTDTGRSPVLLKGDHYAQMDCERCNGHVDRAFGAGF